MISVNPIKKLLTNNRGIEVNQLEIYLQLLNDWKCQFSDSTFFADLIVLLCIEFELDEKYSFYTYFVFCHSLPGKCTDQKRL